MYLEKSRLQKNGVRATFRKVQPRWGGSFQPKIRRKRKWILAAMKECTGERWIRAGNLKEMQRVTVAVDLPNYISWKCDRPKSQQ
jgi:hypothetical protein